MNKVYDRLKERMEKPDMRLSKWTVSRSRTIWFKNGESSKRPENKPSPSLFNENFGDNEWRYVGIGSDSSAAISVDLELGFDKSGSFCPTIGIHKTGEYEWQKQKKEWIRSSELNSDQETRLRDGLKSPKTAPYWILDSRSDTEDDWHWSRSLDSSLRKLDDEAIKRLFRAWRQDTDPFVDQLIEALVDLAKEARGVLVNGAEL
jgi:hypothetical protein